MPHLRGPGPDATAAFAVLFNTYYTLRTLRTVAFDLLWCTPNNRRIEAPRPRGGVDESSRCRDVPGSAGPCFRRCHAGRVLVRGDDAPDEPAHPLRDPPRADHARGPELQRPQAHDEDHGR